MIARSNVAYEKRQAEKRQRMLKSDHPHVGVARIEHVACPLHILELKRQLARIAPAETLRILPGDPAVITDLIAACRALGHDAQRVAAIGGDELYVTRLAAE
jgi:TusA-related sulfurtransferase